VLGYAPKSAVFVYGLPAVAGFAQPLQIAVFVRSAGCHWQYVIDVRRRSAPAVLAQWLAHLYNLADAAPLAPVSALFRTQPDIGVLNFVFVAPAAEDQPAASRVSARHRLLTRQSQSPCN